MNQILYTGGKNKKGAMSSTQKIVVFFVVFIVIFAICAIGLGANLLTKVKNENVANTNTSTNTNQNTTGNNTNTPAEPTTTPQEYIKITFSSELGGVKINVESLTEANIETVLYWWEGEEENNLEVLDTQYETVIASKQGTHYLYVEAIDENGNKKEAKQLVIGDTGPEVTITTDGVSNYVVKVSDDEKITKIEVTLNGELEEIEVNSKEYEYTLPIPQGNSIIEVTAYNLNGLSTNKKAKVTNFEG